MDEIEIQIENEEFGADGAVGAEDALTLGPTTPKTGDPIFDFGIKPITGSSPTVFRRFPRALVTKAAKIGDTVIFVDETSVVDSVLRPTFLSGMKVAIADPSTIYVQDGTPVTISSVTTNTLVLSAGLTVAIPAGATVYLSTKDTSYQRNYRVGFDVTLDTQNGLLLYVVPYPPFDGGDPWAIHPPGSKELIQGQVFFPNLETSPKKFPALYGEPYDDNGDQRYPLVNPSLQRETGSNAPSYLSTELDYVGVGGILTSPITQPLSGTFTGTLDATKRIITLTSGTFPSPVPTAGDLVRITSGLNVSSSYYIVRSATTNSVTLQTVLASVDAGFHFVVTVSNASLPTGTASSSGTVFQDPAATFTSTVRVGYTVVAQQSVTTFQRRQVVSVDSDTQLTLSSAFTPDLVSKPYRISNSFNSFSDLATLRSVVPELLAILDSNSNSERNSLQLFFSPSGVLSDLINPSNTSYPLTTVAGTASGDTLTSGAVNFQQLGIEVGNFVYIPTTQAAQGIYKVIQVIDAHNLQLEESLPTGSLTFGLARVLGVGSKSLTDLFNILVQVLDFIGLTNSWNTLVQSTATSLTVVGDSFAYVNSLTATDVTNRRTLITSTRQPQVSSNISSITTILATSDKLYDARYVWIDERINLKTGILVKQQRAVESRIQAQQDALNAMIKLLAVQ